MTSAQVRQQLFKLLGDLPDPTRPIGVERVNQEVRGEVVLETLLLDLNGVEAVPAYFARARGANGKLPTVLYNHAHGGDFRLGKDELVRGCDALQNPPYLDALTSGGYAVFCLDAWGFGERRGRAHSELFKEMLWHGQVLWGMMVYDSLRALDYLEAREDVDSSRVATLGLSMGSAMAWWCAALDERVKVCIDLCCLTDFHSLIARGNLDGHGIYYYVPSLLKHFTTARINALIAPRAHLSLAGRYDALTPIEGLEKIDKELRAVYRAHNAAEAWQLLLYDSGHYESAAMRQAALTFLRRWL